MLATDTDSRNSDIRLTQAIWWHWHRDSIREVDGQYYINIKDLFNLPREDNIKRIRAKIQNVEHKYLPTDPEVAKKRGWEEEEWKGYLGYK